MSWLKNIYQNKKSLVSIENIFRILMRIKTETGIIFHLVSGTRSGSRFQKSGIRNEILIPHFCRPLGEILFLHFSYRRYESDEQRAIKGKIVDYSKKGNILTQYTAFIGVTDEETPVRTQAAAQRINPEPVQPSYSHYGSYERFVLLFKFFNRI